MKSFTLMFVISLTVVYSTAAGIPFTEIQQFSGFPECNPNIVTWHPHPLTCTSYVICYHGNPIERPCAPGLHYNRVMEQCQWPHLAQCDIRSGCPAVDDHLKPVFLPNESDCSRYYVCFEGNRIARECAADLWWDVQYQWCTFGDDVTCDSNTVNNPNTTPNPTTISPTTVPPTLPPTTEPPVGVPTPPPTSTPDPNTHECPMSRDPSFHPHTRDCEFYFICINGVAFLRQCAEGMYFDVVNRECNDREISTCISGTAINPSERPVSSTFSCPLGDYEVLFYPHQSRCERFFECRKGIAYLKYCPSGQHYDVPNEVCYAKSEAVCLKDLNA